MVPGFARRGPGRAHQVRHRIEVSNLGRSLLEREHVDNLGEAHDAMRRERIATDERVLQLMLIEEACNRECAVVVSLRGRWRQLSTILRLGLALVKHEQVVRARVLVTRDGRPRVGPAHLHFVDVASRAEPERQHEVALNIE